MKVAIIHEWLANMGGSEKVVLALKEIFPDAPVYTTVYVPDRVDPAFHSMDIHTSFIQKLPFGPSRYQSYLPLMPTAVEQFDLSGFDVVISSSHAVAKGVLTGSATLHITYCHTPMRYAWDFYLEYLNGPGVGRLKKKLIPWLMNYIRMWDRLSADRVDFFIANSGNVAQRVKKHYRRESEVIYPPVDTSFFQPSASIEDYYFIVSRLIPYKRIDLAVEAFNRLGLPLKIAGDGPERERLKAMAKSNIEFLGRVTDEEMKKLYSSCRAFIFPGEEDFGITPVEAQASGRPVIAYGAGGCLETVIPGVTGEFFAPQTPEALVELVRRFEPDKYKPEEICAHARKFDREIFKQKILDFIDTRYNQFRV
ncbi:MAG: glycosyltransferase family 4 protein [Firmicutes bacterium HGW-Firmicutes-14]|nr:MAG: glycosyltransferase family 4 protein [Firmicutes bacterium HGW-Firmicutes-14]